MAEYLSPGIYVEEYDNAPRGMEGVETSTAGFVGMAARGPVEGAPTLITGYSDFIRKFGGYLSEFAYGEYRYLASSVEQFFTNGGTRCYVARVTAPDAKCASAKAGILHIEAANAGEWGNCIQVSVSTVCKKKMQLLEKKGDKIYTAKSVEGFIEGDILCVNGEYNKIATIFESTITFENEFKEDVVDMNSVPSTVLYLVETDIAVRYNEEREVYTEVSFNISSPNYITTKMEKSELIKVEAGFMEETMNPAAAILGADKENGMITLADGSDGTIAKVNAGTFIGEDNGPGKRTGIQAFLENNNASMMAVPGITIPEVIVSLVAHCEKTASRFAVIDMPKDMADTGKLIEYRERIDSTYAAMYHPWIQNFDRFAKKVAYFPPSGAIMGIYARTDVMRGVHKAPANESVMCSGLNINFNKGEQDILNSAGVNLIRALPGQGIRVWGARTASSNATFKYVNVSRLFIYVEESIKVNTNWVIFEPNDEELWTRVNISISSFLDSLWRNGMFAGASPDESYYVEIGTSTMTTDDIINGRLICNIGIAPSRPAEFVHFRISQLTAGSGESLKER